MMFRQAKPASWKLPIFLVVNKADKSGADAAAHSLAVMLEIGEELRKDSDNPETFKVENTHTDDLRFEWRGDR